MQSQNFMERNFMKITAYVIYKIIEIHRNAFEL